MQVDPGSPLRQGFARRRLVSVTSPHVGLRWPLLTLTYVYFPGKVCVYLTHLPWEMWEEEPWEKGEKRNLEEKARIDTSSCFSQIHTCTRPLNCATASTMKFPTPIVNNQAAWSTDFMLEGA